jgi:choline kinase
MIGKHKELDKSDQLDLDRTSRHFPASVHAKRLSGRPSLERLGSAARSSFAGNPSISSLLSEDSDVPNTSPNHRHAHESLVKQVTTWLKHEKARRTTRRAKRKAAAKDRSLAAGEVEHTLEETGEKPADDQGRRGSDSSEGSIALESLANILERTLSTISAEASPRKRRASGGSKVANLMKRFSIVSSDTDYFEGAEELVPTCEAVLDNSQTLAYSGGAAEGVADSGSSIRSSRRAKKDKEAWATFKYEILRLAHTLKLKGWRKVPLEQSGEIEVERLSGALTNAVYVVSPPKNLELPGDEGKPKSPPP